MFTNTAFPELISFKGVSSLEKIPPFFQNMAQITTQNFESFL